jgi:hypothetical protein
MIRAERQDSRTKVCELTPCRYMLTDLVSSASRLLNGQFLEAIEERFDAKRLTVYFGGS